MPETKKPVTTGIAATIAFWLAAAFLNSMTGNVEIIQVVAGLIAFTATLLLWIILAWNQLPVQLRSSVTDEKKTKRSRFDEALSNDDRLALLMALMTENERLALRTRLLDELDGEGELRLADLLMVQEQENTAAAYVARSTHSRREN